MPDPRVPRCRPHQGGEVLQPPHRLRLPLRAAECGVHQPTAGQAQGQARDNYEVTTKDIYVWVSGENGGLFVRRVFSMKMVLGVVADPMYLDPELTVVITNKYREPSV
jgi:hypothetical protein